MGNLVEHVEESIASHGLFCRRQRILVAVSGGLDSMVLLHLLHTLSAKHGWSLSVAHLNHQLRSRSSDADARLVRKVAEGLGLTTIIKRAKVREYARKHKLSIEMAARQTRHGFLATTAAHLKMSTVALAHHADDQIELFFLRLFRGSGGEGLAGMEWQSASPADPKLGLVRPLLDQPKRALLEYAVENRVAFREDATNASLDIRRNRIRHELLPLLREHYQPALNETVSRTMNILGADADFVTEAAEAWLERYLLSNGPATKRGKSARTSPRQIFSRLHSTPFEALPVAVQRRGIQLQLLRQGVAAGFEVVESLRLGAGKPVNLPGPERFRVTLDKEGFIELQRPARRLLWQDSRTLTLGRGQGELVLDGARLQWRIESKKGTKRPKMAADREFFDADKVGSLVVVRHWRPGDRFHPIGMACDVKLQDFFTNQKVPRARRHQLLVAETGDGEVFWVEGMRISERFKLTEGTIRRLQWGWQRL